ncbi:MAG: hypothetical protein KDI90_04085 [Alphaproteobacteria bacterium]|nr:hypothetical protein [Alphaproteobacteria bacterium]MCB9974818.1 hypothetical protein [Rhodospirillales bacterium]
MSFEFSCIETDGGIGFEAKGCGLEYCYDGRNLTLDILIAAIQRPVLLIDLGPLFPRNAKIYTGFLEKAAQISALLYSGNQTLNLCETIPENKLVHVIAELTKTAELAHDVALKNDNCFSEKMKKTYGLEMFTLENPGKNTPSRSAYRLALKTHNGIEIRTLAGSARTAIAKTAEKTLRDGVTIEFLYQAGKPTHNAHTLLALSARLSSIARLLDKSFNPQDILLLADKKTGKNSSERTV